MDVATIMSRVLVTAAPTLPATRLVDLMVDLNIGAVPVVEEDGTPVGIVTRGDVLEELEEDEEPISDELPAYMLMHPSLLTIAPSTLVRDAAKLMIREHVHHLLVVDAIGQLVGLVSSLDVVRWVAER
jgi:CBS domain-containing protein